MIYFDNSATSLEKPVEVIRAVTESLEKLGNPGRSFHRPALDASRTVLSARSALARLTNCSSPLSVAFTSGATESLNLVISGLIRPTDHVITTVLEHNSVLRPLYLSGCALSILPCDGEGNLCLDQLKGLLRPETKFLVATHGSNLLGNITPVAELKAFCHTAGLTLILDVSQTLGSVPVTGDMADVLCFTGHKALMGPQGTGGVIAQSEVGFSMVKTGGAGSDSFAPHQAKSFPDVLEAGTPNTHGLAGLAVAAERISTLTLEKIQEKEEKLSEYLLERLLKLDFIEIYGKKQAKHRLPVFAINWKDRSAEEVAIALWDGWEIATRAGSHCAPLVHQHFKTETQGMLRISMGYDNNFEEIDCLIHALEQLRKERP